LKTTIIRRPLRRLTQAELDQFLEKAADILRGNVDHSEFRGYVFALLFFKRISDVYQEYESAVLVGRLGAWRFQRQEK
jgi:type I restriction enzyme M protein